MHPIQKHNRFQEQDQSLQAMKSQMIIIINSKF